MEQLIPELSSDSEHLGQTVLQLISFGFTTWS